MVALVAMMISCTIDKIARIDIVLIDITWDYLHAEMNEKVNMILDGTIAELIFKCSINALRLTFMPDQAKI